MSERVSSDRPAPEKQDEFLTTLAFELEQEINLSSEPAGKDNSNAIIDMLRIQFVDLNKQLDALSFASSEEEKKEVSKAIRTWINSLNAAPLVPLSFRLKTLKQLENFLDVLSKDMCSLILRAYKVGIVHVKDKARHNPQLYGEIIHVAATALQLAIHKLVDYNMRHYSVSPVEIHHNLDIAKLGLVVARSAPRACKDEAARLKCIVAEHELLRRIDMFAHTDDEKRIIVEQLYRYAMFIDSVYVRKGKKITYKKAGIYLLTHLNKPHLKPHRTTRLPEVADDEVIVMYVQGMAKAAMDDLEKVRDAELMSSRRGEFSLEKDLEETRVVCQAIIRAFRVQKREERKTVAKEKIGISILVGIDASGESEEKSKLRKGWVLNNLSEHGAMLQCPVKEGSAIPVSSVLTFYWPKGAEHPRYAIVRWVHATLQGYQRLGVEFVQGRVRSATLHFINIRSTLMHKRDWSALLVKSGHGWQVWMQTKERHHTPLTVSIETGGSADNDICRITPVREHGYNYSVFQISEVLTMEEVKAMALMQGKEEKKSVEDLDF